MKRPLQICLVLALAASAAVMPAGRPAGAGTVTSRATSIRQDVTVLVQTRLRDFGYTIVVDGLYGPQTTAVVRKWQRANGLVQDGMAGRETVKSLGPLNFAATAAVPAVRSTPPVRPNPEGGSVEEIIRAVWPDDLEDWAVRIAYRESRFQPDAHNSCCHGIFQIHFRAHQSWLDDYGVHQPSDLYDPSVNATVALALYQQTGPGPWNL